MCCNLSQKIVTKFAKKLHFRLAKLLSYVFTYISTPCTQCTSGTFDFAGKLNAAQMQNMDTNYGFYCPPSDEDDYEYDADTFMCGNNIATRVLEFDESTGSTDLANLTSPRSSTPNDSSSLLSPNTSSGSPSLLRTTSNASSASTSSGGSPSLLRTTSNASSLDTSSILSPSITDNGPYDTPAGSPLALSDHENESDEFESDNEYQWGTQLPSKPMVNYQNDVENELDYEVGWEWMESDVGPSVSPHTGFRRCLLNPEKNKPEDYFMELFHHQMFTIMAEKTNTYARRRFDSLEEGKIMTIFHLFTGQRLKARQFTG